MTQVFDFYGLTIEVTGADGPLEELRRDFSYFVAPPSPEPAVRLTLLLDPPPYGDLPEMPVSFITPRNACFQDQAVTYIDYFGQGLAVFHRADKRCVVYSEDPELVREIGYLFILSTAGEYLDGRGLHRLHALAVSHRDRGVLLLLPSGGGKSTMALEMLREPDIRLLAEDTPLIDRKGTVLPFPLRLGIRSHESTWVPAEHLRTVRRMEFDPKTLVDLEYFRDRLGGPVAPGAVLVGERNLGTTSAIVPIGRARAFKALIKYMVVGLGVYQGLEFLLERGPMELLGKGRLVASRLYNSAALVARAPSYRFVLGRDRARNRETLLEFIRRQDG
jgi:hypothetical protein